MVSIRKELRECGLTPQKRLGQHFLIDQNILDKVIKTADLRQEDVVLEVGPGLGAMTLALAQKARYVFAVEVDSKLVQILREKVTGLRNVKIICANILRVKFEYLFYEAGRSLKVVANLPYNISTPLLYRFIEERKYFSEMTLMLQREVVERMIAPPGRKEYGALSILVQMVSCPTVRFFIKPSAFFPTPKVESAVVQIVWREDLMIKAEDEDWFIKVVKASFSHRRKTLINSLKHSGLPLLRGTEKGMERAGIDPQRRPETLSIEEFVRLAEVLKSIGSWPKSDLIC